MMRINSSITVTRKMLSRGANPLILIPPDRSYSMLRNAHRIFAKGANTDNRISRIVIYIDTRRKVHINTESD
ncbi:hypothetical protein D3C77_672880 [compost metagenome]